MNNTQIEGIYNQTFGELALFYRDTTLSENLISKYQIGQILIERGFIDITAKGGGLATNLRYLIASANAKDVSLMMPETVDCGHFMLKSNTSFKVLDIYKISSKTQVLLLEIPETAITFFANSTSNIEENIIKKARENFDKNINEEFLPELQNQEWLKRTEFPIGMTDKGELFYQDKNVKSTLETNKVATQTPSIMKKPWWKFW
ncbi:hypothetical protein ATE47_08845 [Chryseobacterium sp. IHB B 17019]|uniref:hypothetical protein n=1 Tax=Chryseobacterium sp. IHB B 17019 TaxID=1721091 RepID=UPI00071FACDC|nr:hypothetical protein [Chryseobacterium sp. IHB B 17019]ALR30625.1 hypothetical protein ATE47_08845 [Chryseobacterium sp. IHB B 17019]